MITSGQLLPHSGLTGLASGQHGILSPCIPAMLAVIWTFDSAIAFSAAIVLTGATSIPSNAQSDMSRSIADMNFIGTMVAWRISEEKGFTENCALRSVRVTTCQTKSSREISELLAPTSR